MPTHTGRARGLVSSRSSGSRIDAASYLPPPELADVVERFWRGEWDLRGQSSHTTELLSDPCVHLVFESSDGAHAGARVVGVWTQLWKRTLAGKGRVRGVKLKAGAARTFLCRSTSEFTNQITPLWDHLGPTPTATFKPELPTNTTSSTKLSANAAAREQLASSILTPEQDAEAFQVFANWLLSVKRADDDVSLAVALVDRIVKDPQIIQVDQLVEISGLSVRPLQRLFKDYVGASPKWVIRRRRLQEVAGRIEQGLPFTLATLAADLGYTDQSHLTRDFKAAVGKTPGEFSHSVHK